MATYNRDGAIRYAKKWCKDHNPNYVYYDGTNKNTDCANFVSQCMYEGGGMPMKNTANNGYDVWYYYGAGNRSSSWTGAQSLRLFIKKNIIGYPRMGYTFLSNDQVGQLQKGDLVFALNKDGTNKNKRTAGHVAMVDHVTDGIVFMYAHSAAKDNQKWETPLEDTILCHFDGTILTGDAGKGDDSSSWQVRYGTATLKASGRFNAYVKNMQEDLMTLGYDLGTAGADGYFGKATTAAVKAFQTNKGLTVDGLAGKVTKAALYSAVYG